MILHTFNSIGSALNWLSENQEIDCLCNVAGKLMIWDGFSLAERSK